MRFDYRRTSKRSAQRELDRLKGQMLAMPSSQRPFEVELRLRIKHLESALQNWVEGVTEHTIVMP